MLAGQFKYSEAADLLQPVVERVPSDIRLHAQYITHLFDAKDLQVTKWGTIKTDFDTMETNLKGVFAAGDIVRGASLVVWAIKDGRDAAAAMKKYLENIELKKSKVA